jgi:hypothetical protein
MVRPTVRQATFTLVGVAAIVRGLCGCEALLDVGRLTERASGDSGQDEQGSFVDATNLVPPDASPGTDAASEQGDASTQAESGTDLAETGPQDVSAAPGDSEGVGNDSGPSPDSAFQGDDASSVADAGDAGDGATAAADAEVPLDASMATRDAGDAAPADSGSAPPKGCAANVTVLVMPTLDSLIQFNTGGAVCVKFKGGIDGWNASNAAGRSVTLVGGGATQTLKTIVDDQNQPGMTAGTDGYIYWNFTAGTFFFASVLAF